MSTNRIAARRRAFFADFSLQSAEAALRKVERSRHLLVYALAAAGSEVGDPATVVLWTTLSVAGHNAVDWTRKLGLRNEVMGNFLDQACHVATILVAVLAL